MARARGAGTLSRQAAGDRGGRPVVIGLTGPIGCGKSTVAGWLAGEGVAIVDADEVARAVTGPGEPALAAVLDRFGPSVARPDGSLDRAALGRIVFADPERLRELEAIVHPAVRPRILSAAQAAADAGAAVVAIEAIKLVEGGLAAECDEVWLVTCDPETQLARLAGRGMVAVDAAARVAAQGDLGERLAGTATRVIDTSGSAEATRPAVLGALRAALAEAGREADGRGASTVVEQDRD